MNFGCSTFSCISVEGSRYCNFEVLAIKRSPKSCQEPEKKTWPHSNTQNSIFTNLHSGECLHRPYDSVTLLSTKL